MSGSYVCGFNLTKSKYREINIVVYLNKEKNKLLSDVHFFVWRRKGKVVDGVRLGSYH